MSRVTLPGGVTLNTRIDGPEGAPWLVLSNSLGTDLTMWDPQIPALSAKYRVLRYDTRGHGESDAPEGPYSFDQLVGDVIGLMDHHGIDKAAFMGMSMGGMTGLGLAIHHPDRLTRVVCSDARADAPKVFRDMWDDRIGKVISGGLQAIAESSVALWVTEDWRNAHPEETERLKAMVTANDPEGYVACCWAIRALDYLKDLGKAGVPILYVGGSHDKGAPPSAMREMDAATPESEFIEIPGAAHIANINAPEDFHAAIAGFLSL